MGRFRAVEQTGRWRTRHQRDHREGPQRPSHAQDEGRLASRLGDDGRQSVCAETLTSDTRRPIPSCNCPLVTDVVQSREMITRGFQSRRSHSEPKRLPPGQHVTSDFPVLSAGATPHTPLTTGRSRLKLRTEPTSLRGTGRSFGAWPNGGDGGYSLRDALVEVRH